MTGPASDPAGVSTADRLRELLAPLRADPSGTTLAFDFDGTLSPVVDDPAAAAPVPGVPGLLDELASQYRRVVVLSGRPVAFLARHLPGTVALSGLYGLESLVDGVVRDHPDAARWRPVVHEVALACEREAEPGAALDGMGVEPKGLSITLHVRTHPDLEPAVRRLAERLAAESGLEARPAKRSIELHPPIAVDKGTALRDAVQGARGALYVGDDVGDLAAFAALEALVAARSLAFGVRLAVGGPELPDEVRRRVALVLPGPESVPGVLRHLRP